MLQVTVYNKVPADYPAISNGLSIHWHGFSMKKAAYYDGISFIHHCPILSGQNFTYRFQVAPSCSSSSFMKNCSSLPVCPCCPASTLQQAGGSLHIFVGASCLHAWPHSSKQVFAEPPCPWAERAAEVLGSAQLCTPRDPALGTCR